MFEKTMSLFKDQIDEIVNEAVSEEKTKSSELLKQKDNKIAELEAEIALLKQA